MKSILISLKRNNVVLCNVGILFLFCLIAVISPSCQKDEFSQDSIVGISPLASSKGKPTAMVGKVKDVDGNWYKTVKIGDQWWMAENLKTTKYSNRDLIGTTNPPSLYTIPDITSKYQWPYNGNESYVATYGRLYTWYAVSDNRNVCPKGWHVPSDAEWTTLTDYLTNNGYGFGGSGSNIAKSMASTSGWTTDPTAGNVGNNQAINNSSGFTALSSGFRWSSNGIFYYMGNLARWWSSTETSTLSAYNRYFYSYNSILGRDGAVYKQNGYSVRCVKD